MESNYKPSLDLVLQHEGGYVNDPQDPGGATNKGVTQAVYDAWRRAQGLPSRSVASIGDAEVGSIYKNNYWDRVMGDELPSGVDYSVFDFAVNSGVNRAARYLQRAVGVADDGKIGPKTLAAVKVKDPQSIIDAICEDRLTFLQHLPTFPRFGGGWTRRVAEVEAKSKEMAG